MADIDRQNLPPLGTSSKDPLFSNKRPITRHAQSVPDLRRYERPTSIFDRGGVSAVRRTVPSKRPTSVLTLPMIADAYLEQYAQMNLARSALPLGPEECIRCMLRVPHKRCEAHKYIRVGGGYRHSYSYLKAIMGDLLVEMTEEMFRHDVLEAIKEGMESESNELDEPVTAIKTFIRTKSGKIIERIVFLSAADYKKFMKNEKGQSDILSKYLSKDEVKNLSSWDKDEVKAVKTFVRTKSGRLKEKLVYISKSDFDKMKSGELNANDVMNVLKKYVKPSDGERIDGWGEAQMKQVKTLVRTKSGRIVEKTVMVSKEEYEELQKITKAGGDPAKILGKYMSKEDKVEGWKKVSKPAEAMKVVKTKIRTKSGRIIEKTIMLTEEQYREFEASGGDVKALRKYAKLAEGENIDEFEKASTVYGADSDDEVIKTTKVGQRVVGEDGVVYEVMVDPTTGKKFKKKLGRADEFDDLDDVLAGGEAKKGKGKKGKGKRGKKGKGGGDDSSDDDDLPTHEEVKKYQAMKKGKRDTNSDSEFSYRSVHSAGGTRKVLRKRKKADGTYSDEKEYDSANDEKGEARRRRRRRERKHADSAHSYYSVQSAGGTRTVRRKKKNKDGTYGSDEEYHSDASFTMKKAAIKRKKEQKAKKKKHGSDSEHSYFSERSVGGTRVVKKRKRIRDAQGKVVGHGNVVVHESDSDSSYEEYIDKSGKKQIRKKEKPDKKGRGRGRDDGEPRARGAAGGFKSKLGKSRKDFKGGFSDQSTDTEDEPDLDAMSEGEKKVYLEKKAQRKAERDQKRREKYGDKYEEIMKKHDKNKKQLRKERAVAEGIDWDSDEYEANPEGFKQKYKTLVTYDKSGERGLTNKDKADNRGIGIGHDDWGGKGKKGGRRKPGDEYEADAEGDDGNVTAGRKKGKPYRPGIDSDDGEIESYIGADGKKKKRLKKGVDEVIESDYEYEIEYDKEGRVIRKKKKYHDGESGSEYEYEYDELGNLLGKKQTKKGAKGKKHVIRDKFDNDDGQYFEKGADGKLRLKAGRKKIDINKLSKDDLKALGIDPNMSKQDIARALKSKFGDEIRITKGGHKVGLKGADEFDSDANTDDLADDSDLDVSTIKPGRRRVQILMRKGGEPLMAYMKQLVDDSNLVNAKPPEPEQDASIDYLSAYRLVDQRMVDVYARAFVVEDDAKKGIINYDEARGALEGVSTISNMTQKQIDYIMKVLEIAPGDKFSFRMFGVAAAIGERISKMDAHCKHLLQVCDLADIERKLMLYREMFFCNTQGDRDKNFIKCEALMIELIAGGLSWQQQDYVMSQLRPNSWSEISFLDYLVYIPLFLSMHDGICLNPLDMSLRKYQRKRTGYDRDVNPLGYPLKQGTAYHLRQQADQLLSGKQPAPDEQQRNKELLHKYAKLPDIIGTLEKRPPGAPRYL